MKILRVISFPPEYIGGLPLYGKNISLNLAQKKNVECDILTSDILNTKKKIEYLDPKVRIIYKKCFSFIGQKNPLVNFIPFIKRNHNNYDIIHAHGYYYFSTLQCAFLKRLLKYPFILHIHGGIQTPYSPVSDFYENIQLIFKENIFDRLIGRVAIRSADILISVAKKDLEIIRKVYNVSEKLSFHIPNGVNINKFKKNNKIERRYITLIATRLTYIKGVDIFIKIIKELYNKNRSLKFLILGDGPLKDLVLQAKKSLPIKFYPTYPYDKIQDIYNMSKLLLITSRTEGVPNTIYESFACETPVISSNVGGVSSVIKPNVNGYLYNIKKLNNIANLILDLINDEKKIQRLGENGRKLIEKEYSWEIITEKLYKIYQKIKFNKII
ncbi:MAG: glycosyltransferase family 4 protein [Promethearchaeota archaeon]